ncbi:hypothetical protein Tco_1505877 [Tanacetum coccineum]
MFSSGTQELGRADGGSNNYKIFSEMLDDFDRQDILFQPDEEDEVWRHQHEYNLISWRLFDSCGIHILLMDNGIAIHMMIEKKYPLTQEMLLKMLSRKLEVDHENEMAFELLSYFVLPEKINTAEDLRLLEEDCMKIKNMDDCLGLPTWPAVMSEEPRWSSRRGRACRVVDFTLCYTLQ